MKTIEEKLELLNETAGFFNLSNRCTNALGRCCYFAPDKEGCAIGRKIQDKELCRKLDAYSIKNGVTVVFRLLPLELQDYGVIFLDELQRLHDSECNWSETGLSTKGIKKVEWIRKMIIISRC